jgi:hypothetical protein
MQSIYGGLLDVTHCSLVVVTQVSEEHAASTLRSEVRSSKMFGTSTRLHGARSQRIISYSHNVIFLLVTDEVYTHEEK